MGKMFLGSQNWVSRPNIRVLLGGTAKNTDRLLRMLPGLFLRELSGTVSRFSRVLLRGTIAKRTYGTHKKLYISRFLLARIDPIYYGPP